MGHVPDDGTEVVLAVEGTYQRTVAVVGRALDGALVFCWPAERATDDELRRILDQAADRWKVIEIVHNRRIRQRLFRDLANDGVPCWPWPTAVDVEAGSANELYRAIVEQRVVHDHEDLLAVHMRN